MSPLLLPAVLLGFIAAAAGISWFLERRQWFHDVQMYVDDPPLPDDRSSIEIHRRLMDTRDAA